MKQVSSYDVIAIRVMHTRHMSRNGVRRFKSAAIANVKGEYISARHILAAGLMMSRRDLSAAMGRDPKTAQALVS